jgi:hypothetical protein
MRRPGYRDDPFEADDEGKPFTEEDWRKYAWADAWRDAVHAIEAELYEVPEVKQAIVDAKASANHDPQIFHVREESISVYLKVKP